MPSYDHEYIVGFTPNASMNTAHHILIYGCETPGYYERDTPRAVWNCGEMAHSGSSEYKTAPTCARGSQVIYAWAMDAPALKLPQGVGFKVGGDTGVKFLVLQVHYANVDRFLRKFQMDLFIFSRELSISYLLKYDNVKRHEGLDD